MRVTLFAPCYVDAFDPGVARAARRVLERLGHDVQSPCALTCCGQPAFNAGHEEPARKVAGHILRALADAETVVVPSGSCAAMIHTFYPDLFRGAPEEPAARALAGRTWEFSSFLADRLGIEDVGARFDGRVTWHDGCHGLRELGIHAAPRRLLARVRGLTLVEMADAQVCCGFGGSFAVKFPALSGSMAEAKAARVAESGATHVASNDPSCLLHLRSYARRQGLPFETIHLAEILAAP